MLIGWDVSTSAIGVCVRSDDGAVVEFTVLYPEGETHMEKHRSATTQINDYLHYLGANQKLSGTGMTHVIEDCLGGFTGGLTTKQTLMKLAAMNAVVSHLLSWRGQVMHISPVTTKRITGLKVPKGGNKKLEVIKLVRSREPTFPYAETKAGNYVKGTDDMADAWLLSEAGVKLLSGEASIGPAKKAPGRRGKARGAEDPEG